MDTIALNCLVSEKIVFLHFGDRLTEKLTYGETDGQFRCTKPLSLSRALAYQEAQLSQRDRTMLGVIEYFAKLHQDHSK